ncbi:type I restriction enzyme S subunit [Bradyrhizobium sp. USDA 4472]
MSELPKGWEKVRLEDCAILSPRHQGIPPRTTVSFVPMPAVSDINGEIESAQDRPFSEVSKGYTHFQTGDVIFAKITPCMENGKIAVARRLTSGIGCGSTEFHVLRPLCDISPDFIWRFLRRKSFRADAEGAMTGAVGQRRVPLDYLRTQILPLPPLDEQRRIVSKIDSLSAKSKRACDNLDHIPRLVEKYKQAILTAAFRGDLTREWRNNPVETSPTFAQIATERAQLQEEHRQRLQRCDMPALSEELKPFDIPNHWAWVRAEAICGFITKGTTPKSAAMSNNGEIPFIKVYNLTFDGTLDFTVEPTFVSRTTHEGFLSRSKVLPGDVLMNIVGPPLGKVSVVPNDRAEWNINQAIAVFRPIASVSPVFLSKWLLTDVLTRWAVSRSKATAGQSNLTLEICRDLPIPLCSLAEQQEIGRRIQSAFSWIDRLAAEATSARKLIDHLDQAILAKAFRGELVPQDQNDEPASVLLQRLKEERKATATPTSSRGGDKASSRSVKRSRSSA